MSEVTFSNSIFQNNPVHFLQRSPTNVPEIKILSEPRDAEGRIGSYVNFSAVVQANNPQFQWYNKHGEPMPQQCRNNLTIGPVREEDFGFYRLEIIDGSTEQSMLTRWTELRKVRPRVHEYNAPRLQLIPTAHFLGPRIFLAAHFVNAASYQWSKDGVKLEGCVCNTLIYAHAIAGEYSLVASNGYGSSCVEIRVECM